MLTKANQNAGLKFSGNLDFVLVPVRPLKQQVQGSSYFVEATCPWTQGRDDISLLF